ncbi:peptidoglycan-binding domain-containing protein [Salibaculum sp.]|uniref:peptidoglycan-binding domain-containing protein n=1 Tax=Salibaculum sp. TaxID=2855480 RepID=UPI002B48882B|nr:peptidoglycan-binding protein [Salibaculum sp.]HKL69069.1 peptidoglycan-binding protein [Salibaculum sp.]
MPINSSLFISGSVGAGGRNKNQDVAAVQQRLNDLMNPPRQPLVVDGLSGPKTIRAIRDFQKCVMGFHRGDGRVDPDAKTIRGLSDPSSEGKWAGMSMPSQEDMRPPKGPGAGLSEPELDNHEKLHAAISNELEDQDYAQEFLDESLKNYGPAVKGMIATLGEAGNILKVAQGIKVLKDAGLSAPQAAQVLGVLLRTRSAPMSVAFLKEMGKHGQSIAPKLRALGRGAVVLSVIVTALEYYNHWQKGEYGAAAGKAYELGMSVAVPWAAVIGAIQAVIEGMAPTLKGNPYFDASFKILRTLNPIAAGGVGIDAVVTIVNMTIEGLMTGKINWSELDRLVERMRNSPLGVFTEIGDSLGDAAFDFYEWASS